MNTTMTAITFFTCLTILAVALVALVLGVRTKARLDAEVRLIELQKEEMNLLRHKVMALEEENAALKVQLNLVNTQFLALVKASPLRG